MPGGILSMVCYGCNDLYLTGAPQITFFKIAYRRYTNFSVESVVVSPNNHTNFGEEIEIMVPRIGDLMSKTYLTIDIPETYFSFNEFEFTSTTPTLDATLLANYNKVKSFMKYNTAAYRSILRDYKVTDISTTDIKTNLDILINGDGQIAKINFENLYNDGLPDILKFYIKTSNIFTMTEDILSVDTTDTEVINSIYNIAENSIQTSIKCQGYYFSLYNAALKKYNIDLLQNLKFSWNTNLGHSIIEYIDVYVGGEYIDRTDGELLEIYYQLKNKNTKDEIYNKMIGNVESLYNFDSNKKPAFTLYIPFQFWFTKNIGSSFPLVASQHSDVIFKIKFKSLNNCATIQNLPLYDYTLEDLWNDKNYYLNCSLLIDYIFLDGLERRKFAQSSHEYLIETTQIEYQIINTTNFIYHLNMKHPCKEFIWFFQKEIYRTDDFGKYTGEFNNFTLFTYAKRGNPMIRASIALNGDEKINKFVGSWQYYNYIQPYQHHTRTPLDGVNIYSNSLAPEELQPSGQMNLSRIKDVAFNFELEPNAFYYYLSEINPDVVFGSGDDQTITTNLYFKMYAICYNILRFSNGYVGLAFSAA
jgi:hypothetical protein